MRHGMGSFVVRRIGVFRVCVVLVERILLVFRAVLGSCFLRSFCQAHCWISVLVFVSFKLVVAYEPLTRAIVLILFSTIILSWSL